jgi:hypothetical protein
MGLRWVRTLIQARAGRIDLTQRPSSIIEVLAFSGLADVDPAVRRRMTAFGGYC